MKVKANATVRAEMARLGVTQSELADRLGISQALLCLRLKKELSEEESGELIATLIDMRTRDQANKNKLHPVHDMEILDDMLGAMLTDIFVDGRGALRFSFDQDGERYDVVFRNAEIEVSECY